MASCLLDKFRIAPVLRRIFDLVFSHFSIRELTRLECLCSWMKKEKDVVLQAGAFAAPNDKDAEQRNMPLDALMRDYEFRATEAAVDIVAAVKANSLDQLDELCTQWYGNVQVQNNERLLYSTATYLAALNGQDKILHFLLFASNGLGGGLETPDEYGVKPLQIARIANKILCVELLLQAGAVDERGRARKWVTEKTFQAICEGNAPLLRDLLAFSNVDSNNSDNKSSNLQTASTELLNKRRQTLPFVACWYGQIDCLRLLLSKGGQAADIWTRDKQHGLLPIEIARVEGYSECVELLEQATKQREESEGARCKA